MKGCKGPSKFAEFGSFTSKRIIFVNLAEFLDIMKFGGLKWFSRLRNNNKLIFRAGKLSTETVKTCKTCYSEMWIVCWMEMIKTCSAKKWPILTMLETWIDKWVLSISLNCLIIVPSTQRVRPKKSVQQDGIDGNDALENWLCLKKIIARMNLQISTRKIYCKTSNYKGLHLKNIIKNWDVLS